MHSWDLGLKGECSNDEIAFMNSLIANRRKHIFGTHQDGKALSKAQIETFFKHSETTNIIKNLIKKGYLKEKTDYTTQFAEICLLKYSNSLTQIKCQLHLLHLMPIDLESITTIDCDALHQENVQGYKVTQTHISYTQKIAWHINNWGML